MTPITPTTSTARIELRLPVEATDPPLGYPNGDDTIDVEVALGGGGFLNLVVPVEHARMWAGDLFAAVTTAHRDATGDPHALSHLELSQMSDPNSYDPASTLHLEGTDDQPARMRFTITVDIAGLHLSDGPLRAALVEALTTRFNTTHIAVSNGTAIDP